MIRRGELWWADLGVVRGSGPALRRPVVVVSADSFNRSRINTVLVAALTTNLRLADAPGNVAVPGGTAGLEQDSVVNVSQLLTLDKDDLERSVGRLPRREMQRVDAGLRRALDL